MKKYKIGQLAKMMCVSLDFIRFYEDKGLIASTIDINNHYHYYDISQSEIIYKIQQYRKLGYNVNETVTLLKDANKEQLASLFSSRSAVHNNNLKISSFAIRYLDFLQTVLNTEAETWYISLKPAIWFLPHTQDDDYLEDPDILSAYKTWNEQVPFVYSMDRWVIDSDGTLREINHGRAIECTVADEFGLKLYSPAERYPEKRCIEYYLDNENASVNAVRPALDLGSIQNALDVVREKSFVLDGDVFLRHVLFYNDGLHRHDLFVVYIPIE